MGLNPDGSAPPITSHLQAPPDTHTDLTAANAAYFDEHAHKHEVHGQELGRRAVNAMRKAWPELFDDERTVVMDYACGTGAVSQQLCQYVRSVIGVDISPASVERYNTHVANQGLGPDEMRVVYCELRGEPGELDGVKFDVAVCCASYHHFPALEHTTRVLASFLKPGGSLLVADIRAAEDGHEIFPPVHHHIVPHTYGLSEETMQAAFEGAGLVEFQMRQVFKARMRSTKEEVQWFVARGVKPT